MHGDVEVVVPPWIAMPMHTSTSTLKPHYVTSSTFSNASSQTCSSSFGLTISMTLGNRKLLNAFRPLNGWRTMPESCVRSLGKRGLKRWHRLHKSTRVFREWCRLTWKMSRRWMTEISPLATRNAGTVVDANIDVTLGRRRWSDRKGGLVALCVYGLIDLACICTVHFVAQQLYHSPY